MARGRGRRNAGSSVTTKTEADWERFGTIVSSRDPFHHLLSIHNGRLIFNQTRPWITHASIQNGAAVIDPNAAVMYRDTFNTESWEWNG